MRRFVHAVLIAALSTAIIGCKKDKDLVNPKIKEVAATYLPQTTGSWWKYAINYPRTDTVTVTMTPDKQTMQGKIYFIAQMASKYFPSIPVYYAVNGHDYNQISNVPGYGDFNFSFLNDTAKVGYQWTVPAGDNAINGRKVVMTTTIVEKDISKTIDSKTYEHVIHTTGVLQYTTTSSSNITWATYDFYVARGIGIIEVDASLQGKPTYMRLVDYAIKVD
ncbi:hypothetical protein MUY27_01965 [Mucilaginibacter sp. RS28]|uniref:Uncharacterized protein n=1 Tax=Mucilaginibacter straminoryzae TaxID=2932774 RepID=A0A9X2B7L2_9SPHI|nr:hypothetical protein [Mucilaginibacter straminoryzae]MCJ8208456.1 hypothetical protein [Mucilaginibacter straminoryzae]